MKTEELLSTTGETIEYARLYLNQQKDYMLLEGAKRMAKISSRLITLAVVVTLGFMVLLFLSVAVGLLLGDYINSYGIAFLWITVFYAALAAVIYIFKKTFITNPIVAFIIRDLMD